MKLKLLLFLFLSQIFISAQVNDALKYFPYKTGDMWEYFYSDGPMYVDTLQNLNIKDSTDSEGNIYLTQSAMFINPVQSPVLLSAITTYKIDTTNNFVYGAIEQTSNALLYKLNANLGDKWVIWNYQGNGFEMVRINEKIDTTIFGVPTIIKSYVFYFAFDSTDTTGLDRKSDYLAKGFGLFSRGGGDLVGNIHLTGAVIDGILYGDTTDIITSINDSFLPLPNNFTLYQNYPNPFNPSTEINYSLKKDGIVVIKVFDVLGKEVALLKNKYEKVGNYIVNFNAANLPSGIYFYRITAGSFQQTKKMLLLK